MRAPRAFVTARLICILTAAAAGVAQAGCADNPLEPTVQPAQATAHDFLASGSASELVPVEVVFAAPCVAPPRFEKGFKVETFNDAQMAQWDASKCVVQLHKGRSGKLDGSVTISRPHPFTLVDLLVLTEIGSGRITAAGRSMDLPRDARAMVTLNWEGITSFTVEVLNAPRAGAYVLLEQFRTLVEPDPTPPVVSPVITGTAGTNGWFVSDVVGFSWNVVDPESYFSQTGCGAASITSDGERNFTCTATSFGGTTNASETVKRDVAKPVLVITGNQGTYKTNEAINIECSASDETSGIASDCQSYVKPARSLTPGSHVISFQATDRAGHVTSQSLTLTLEAYDLTPPVIESDVAGTSGMNGWFTSNVLVSWRVADHESAITQEEGCAASTVTVDTREKKFTCSATSEGGLATRSVTIRRDATKPLVIYSGNLSSYTVDQTISIACAAQDVMSGVASNNCANISGDAYAFSLGANNFSATAKDVAGNTASASTSFTVSVTTTSLSSLVTRFVTDASVAKSLNEKLEAAAASIARGNTNSKAGQLGAFENQVNAKTGKSISADHAAILIRLARAL